MFFPFCQYSANAPQKTTLSSLLLLAKSFSFAGFLQFKNDIREGELQRQQQIM